MSHSEEFAHETDPKLVIYEPTEIKWEIDGKRTVNIACGEEFSIFVTEDWNGVQEVWGTGHNMHGQLGINWNSHLCDVTKVEDISDFVDEAWKPLKISHLVSGNNHSIAVFDYGAFFIWGDNLKG